MHTQLCNCINFFHRYFYKIRLQMDFIKIHYLTINVSFNLTEGGSSYLRNIYYLDFHCSDYSQNIVVQSLEYFQNAVFQSPEYYLIVIIQFSEDIIMQLFHFLDIIRIWQFIFPEYYQNVVFKFTDIIRWCMWDILVSVIFSEKPYVDIWSFQIV